MVHHVQDSMADGTASARAERAAGEAGGGGWPTASRIDAQRDPAQPAGSRRRGDTAFSKKSTQVKSSQVKAYLHLILQSYPTRTVVHDLPGTMVDKQEKQELKKKAGRLAQRAAHETTLHTLRDWRRRPYLQT